MGCANLDKPSTPTNAQLTVDLVVEQQTASFSFTQDGQKIPLVSTASQWKITLEPKPFTFEVHGNQEPVSLMALKNAALILPLRKTSAPVVVFTGTSHAYYQNNLFVTDEPLEMYEGTPAFFTEMWGESSENALAWSSFLKEQIGSIPLILLSTRTYFTDEQDFINAITIETIDEKQIKSGDSLLLVAFVEKELGKIFPQGHIEFQQVNWLEFSLDFK